MICGKINGLYFDYKMGNKFMRIGHLTKHILIVFMVATLITGCSSNSDYVETVTTDVADDNQAASEENAGKKEQQETGSSMPITDEISGDNLTPEISNMIPLCDAVLCAQVESARTYSSTDAHLIWKSLRIALGEAKWKTGVMEEANGLLYVKHEKVNEYAYAMFGQLSTLPNIPDDMIENSECMYQNSPIDGEISECFALGDRGLTTIRVDDVAIHNDASISLTLSLVDLENEEEIASFVYDLRPNSKNTSKSAEFHYEITDSHPADDFTRMRMAKVPYIVPIVQLYGNGAEAYLNDGRSSKHEKSCAEVLNYTCFGEPSPAIVRLNERINYELDPNSENDKGVWNRIVTYPITGQDYVQMISTVSCESEGSIANYLYSYNYSKGTKSEIKREDALAMVNLSEDELIQKVIGTYGADNDDEALEGVEYCGFLIKDDESIEFYVKLNYANAAGGAVMDRIASFSTDSNRLIVFDTYDDIVKDSVQDKMSPELTHGRDS